MIKNLVFSLLIFSGGKEIVAQNEYWFFGNNGPGIDFSGGNAAANNGLTPIDFGESVTVVSDGTAGLLFYSDGQEVYDKNHLRMPSGVFTGTGGNSAAQGAISISHPSNPNRFYIFTADDSDDAFDYGIRWHEVDIAVIGNGTPGNPSGDVISSDNVIIGASAEMLTANGCGDTIWVIGHGKNNDAFYAIPVTAAGPQAPIVTNIGVVMTGPQLRGTLGFNSDGTKLISTNGNGNARIMDFNPLTGILSNEVVIPGSFYGTEWSSTDNVIYLTAATGQKELFHYDVSTTVLTSIDTSRFYGEIVTGRDGNMYIGKWAGSPDSNLAVISSPNSLIATPAGIAFDRDGWHAGATVAYGLPQNLACPIIICPDTTTSQPNNICVGFSVDMTNHIVGDPGTWTITGTPAGSNPAVISGQVFDATNMNTDPGIYTLTFKSDNFHPTCDSMTKRRIEVYPLPDVSLGNDTAICADSTVTFNAAAGISWVWNTGATTQTINTNNAGNYDVIATDGNGCIGYDTIALTINSLPIVNLGNDTAICADGTITFDAATGTNWTWNTGASTQTIVANSNGNYDVIVTDANGCVGYDTIALSINSLPVINLGNDTAICADSSITFDASIGSSWQWNTGATSQNINVNINGNYDVIVTDVNGCVGYDTIALSINALPIVNLGNDTAICADSTITFDAAIGTNWVWNNTATTQSINVNTSGNYDVIVTDANGCVGYDTIALNINALPIVDLGNDTAICFDSTIVFDAVVGSNWTWSTGASIRNITVNTSGQYDVIVTDINGCVGYDTIGLNINALPIVDLGNDTAICIDSTIVFDAVVGVNWNWSTGATTQTVNVNTSNNYDVIVTDVNGCVGYDTIALSINALPIVNLGNDTSICADSTIVFDAITGTSWNWNTGDNTQTITVNNSGNYDVIVTDINNCVGYDTIALTINSLPIVNLGNDTAICADSTITFDAKTGTNWLWNNGDATQTTTVNKSGNYNVIVTDINNCVGYDTIALSINALPVINLGNDTSICSDSTITFDAVVGSIWEWNHGENGRSTTVNTGGTYDVITTDINGCVGYDTITLVINALPLINLGIDSSLCAGDSMVIFGGLNNMIYQWNPNNEITDSIIVKTAGTYDIIATDTNNCVGYDTIIVTVDELPIVDLGIDSSLCEGDTMLINAGKSGDQYLWSTGETTQTITVNTANDYSVKVTNDANCFSHDTIIVTVDPIPVVDLGNDTAICIGLSITLDALNEGEEFDWNTEENTQFIDVETEDTYVVTVTNEFNCSTTDSIFVATLDLPIIELTADRLVCDYLSFDATVKAENATYFWNTGDTTRTITITEAGFYKVQVIDTNNCYNVDTINVTAGPDLEVELEVDTFICLNAETTTNLTVLNQTGDITYSWNTGSTNEDIVINSTGNYKVLVIDSLGCWGTDSAYVIERGLPSIELIPDTLSMCSLEPAKESVLITGQHNGEYLEWGTGDIQDSYTTGESGFFEATVYDSLGCTNYDSVTIAEYCRPISITLPNIFTPNGDGQNDRFVPLESAWEDFEYIMYHVENISVKILNRWGERVFVSLNELPNWDGITSKGLEAPSGTYYWIFEYTETNGDHFVTNGFVQLLR